MKLTMKKRSVRPLFATLALVAMGAMAPAAGALPIGGGDQPMPVPIPRPPRTTTTRAVDPPAPLPRYSLQAVWFQCVDETGNTQVGSDEPQFTFDATDGQGVRTHKRQSFGDVDSGESRDFNSSTRMLSAAAGSVAPITLAADVIEDDTWPDYDDNIGHRDLVWSAAELQATLPNVGMTIVQTQTFTGDSSRYILYLTLTRVS